MERRGKELIKQVNTLTKESEYNATQNKNLELMIKHMDENLQLIVRENVELRNEYNRKMSEKNEEINQMRDLAHRIIVEGDQDLFLMVLDQARQTGESGVELRLEQGSIDNGFSSGKKSQPEISKGSSHLKIKQQGETQGQKNLQAVSQDHGAGFKAISQGSDQTKKKNSPNISTKKEEANLIMRLAELKRENDSLRKQNHQMREKFLKYSVSESLKDKSSQKGDVKVKDDESIFLTKTNHSSLANSEMMLDDLDIFNCPQSNTEIYEHVKLGQGNSKGINFKWSKKKPQGQPSIDEFDDTLSRTTLRKTLGAKSNQNARARHFQHNQKPEKDIYCALV